MHLSKTNQPGTGRLIGVGVGPGDPDLLTLKAYRSIKNAEVISFLTNERGESQSKWIARNALKENTGAVEIAIPMPMNENRSVANEIYDQYSEKIKNYLMTGKDVVFLCEGDPLFFGSFAYLLARLQPQFECLVIPGISSVNAAASCLLKPLTQLTQSFAVVSGRHSESVITQALKDHDTVVIMKAGRAREKILNLLALTGRADEASYLEYIGREQQLIELNVNSLKREKGPYFSLFVVTKEVREDK